MVYDCSRSYPIREGVNPKRTCFYGYLIMKCSREGECIPLVESETKVHLLGIEDGRLYYLEL